MLAKESGSGKGGLIFTLIVSLGLAATAYFSCAKNATDFNSEAPDLGMLDGLASTTLPLPADGSKPEAHSPNENAYYAFTAMAQADSFVSYTTGEAITKVAFANVTQDISAHRIVNGNEVYKESVSHSSFKGVGKRTYVNGGNYIVWDAEKVSSIDSVSWEESASKITKDDFTSLFGSIPYTYTAYILTDETIIDSKFLSEENGIYSFRYDLDTEEATKIIAMEMRTMAGTKSLPLFEKVSLIVRMDENWRIREIETDCVYQVDMLGGVTCSESVTEVFSDYNANTEIPNGDFLRSYMDEETVSPLPEELTPTDYLMNGFGDYLTGEKPLRVTIDATGSEELPLSLNGKAEIHINLDDLSTLSVRADIDSVSYGEIALSDLFIGYQQNTAYVQTGDLKAYGTVEEITAFINRLLPLFNDTPTETGAPLSDAESETEGEGGLDFAKLLENATLVYGEGTATVELPLVLGDIALDVSILFNDGDNVSFAAATVTIEGITVTLSPDDTLTVSEIEDDYHNIAPLFEIIDESGNVPLNVTIGDSVNALVNLHLADMTADINLGDIRAKYAQDTVFLKYNDLKLKLALSDLKTVMDKLSPILEGKVDIPDLEGLVETLDVMALLAQATSDLSMTEENGVLTIATGVDGIDLAIRLQIAENGYVLQGIDAIIGETVIAISPATVEIEEIATETLGEYYNIVTLLDIIQGNEINLKANIEGLEADICINLVDMTVLAKTELYNETLYLKLADEIVYISYLGLNVSADINEIDTVLSKLEPIIGKIDTSALKEFKVDDLLSNISVLDDENLTISAEIFGFFADIVFDTKDGNLTISSISLSDGKEFNASVIPAQKASYDMPEGTYYNIVTLLDIIQGNEINLKANIEGLEADICINLVDMTVFAKVKLFENDTNDLFIKFTSNEVNGEIQNIIYASYKGLNVYIDLNKDNITLIENKLTSIIGKDFALPDFSAINTEKIISGIEVNDGENGLILSASLFGFNADIVLDTADGNLTISSISLSDGKDFTASVLPAQKASYDMPEGTYYNIVTLLDIIDTDGNIALSLYLDGTEIKATVNLRTMALYATVEGVEIYADLNTGDAYVRYPGVQAKLNINDIEYILDKLQPIIDKFAGESTLPALDMSGFENFKIEDLLSTVQVTKTESGLAIALEISGVNITLNCLTANGDLSFDNAVIAGDGMDITAVRASETLDLYFDTSEDYVDVKALVDTFGATLNEVFTSDTLSVTLGGTIVSGNTTIRISSCQIDIAGLTSAPKANAKLVLDIVKTNDDGTTSTTTHTIRLVYHDPSLVAEGATNVYFTYDNASDSKVFEGTFTTTKVEDTLLALREIYKNMPELQDELKPALTPDEDGYPSMPETSIDLATLIHYITFANDMLSVNLNGNALMDGLSESLEATLSTQNGALNLDIPSMDMNGMKIGLTLSLAKPADGVIPEETFAYTASSNASDFSSINELLETLANTSKYRSFRIDGMLDFELIGSIDVNDKVKITAQLDVIKQKTYAVVKIEREYVSVLGLKAWDDYNGYATLYFDPDEQMIYIEDVSRREEKSYPQIGSLFGQPIYDYTKPIYSYPETITYKKFTVEEFTSDLMTNLLDMLHLADKWEKLITDKQNEGSTTTTSTATIENTFLKYAYNGTDTFTIDLDLEPLTKDIHGVQVKIGHDADMNISSLFASMSVIDILTLELSATHAAPYGQYQGTVETIAKQKASGNYNS